MRKTFQKYLFVFVFAAFALAFWTSFSIQTGQAIESAVVFLNHRIEDAKEQIKINQRNLDTVWQLTSDGALSKAHAVAQMITFDPDFIYDAATMDQIAQDLSVEDISISDENGLVVASILAPIGYDMSSSPQSKAFMNAIHDPDFALVQEPMQRGSDNVLFQYAGVSRIDEPGIVQIGYTPARLARAMQVANIENLAASFGIGTGGQLFLFKDNEIVSIKDTAYLHQSPVDLGVPLKNVSDGSGDFFIESGGQKMLCAYSQLSDYTIVALLPENEIFASRNETALSLALYNLILFAVVFILVSVLIDKIVIKGIHTVNRSLSRITQGNLEERVTVQTNSEFISLSEGINATVTALKESIAQAAARIDKELEFARVIQFSALPPLEPFTKNPAFCIAASMYTAREVGGDFL